MFYKIGFYILLVMLALCIGVFMKTNPMKNTGALSWVDILSEDPSATIGFLDNNFGIKVTETKPSGLGTDYHIIKAPGQLWPFAGIMKTPEMSPPQSMIYLTVKDFSVAHKKAIESGAKVVSEPMIANGDMKFAIYTIPGGITIGITQYGVKE